MDRYFFTYWQLDEAIKSKDYKNKNKQVELFTLRYPISNDQVHFIKNQPAGVSIPIGEAAFSEFVMHKNIKVQRLNALKICYIYEKL